MEKAREFQKSIYFCFIDYVKAFDCVDHNKLWKILKEMGIPDHLTCLLRNLYAGQEATVRTGHGTTAAAAAAKSLQLCPTLCDPIDGSPRGSPFPGILQARILECVATSFSRGSYPARDQTLVSCTAGGFFTSEPPGKPDYKNMHHDFHYLQWYPCLKYI